MGKHESIKDEPSGAAATAPAPAFEASATPIMALAGSEAPNLETALATIKIESEKLAIAAQNEMPKIEFASTEIPKIESPRIAPEIDAGAPGADDAATAADVPEPPAEGGRRTAAVSSRDVVAKEMTPEQLAEAQRLAREWQPR